MKFVTAILIANALALLAVLPTWPYSRGWGYGPSGLIGAVLAVLMLLTISGRVPV